MENPFEEITNRLERIERLLNKGIITPDVPPVFGVDICSQITGYAKPTIYKNTSKKLIPHFVRDGKLYFKRDEIYAWMTQNKVKTMKESLDEMDQAFVNKRSKKIT